MRPGDGLTRLMRMTARAESMRRRRAGLEPPAIVPYLVTSNPVFPGVEEGSEPEVVSYNITPPLQIIAHYFPRGGAISVDGNNVQTIDWTDAGDEQKLGKIGGSTPQQTEPIDVYNLMIASQYGSEGE